MNKRERQELVTMAVHASGRMRVVEMSERTGVSEMTIRRDLEEMEAQGLLVRVHGGAVSTVSRSFEPGFAVRAQQNVEAKERIGATTAQLLRDTETLILDAGTTTLYVARALRTDIRLRVMALSLHVACVLADQPNVTLMLPGAVVRPHEWSFVGGLTTRTFEHLTFDTVVLTSGGVDVAAGVTEYEFDDAETKRAALRSARRVIVAADASKLGAVAFVKLCPIEDVDVLVTDTSAPAELVSELRTAGVDVILA